ncbi:unnamed protein product [Cylicostephanus goldi]|uniref:7TM GPCR serpentine receptor class x (Srx) domain-containing protein n=1 Tax=Cylicostephanus goldi TaxID=71465 RepID=A0A3P6RX11_CYLGO|nr:unnamed protein product [Cylicostephanus goldi]
MQLQLLTKQMAIFVVFLVWSLGFLHTVPYFWRASCYIYFDSTKWTWIFADTPCGKIFYYVANYEIVVLFATVVIDCITVLKFKQYTKAIVPQNADVRIISDTQKRKYRIETRFFKQVSVWARR